MSKILKRPMFRIGGSANEGIVSMVEPRRNYNVGSPKEERITKSAEEYARLLEKFAGPGPSTYSDLGDLLISGGLNLMSGRGAGKGTLGAIAESYKDPYAAFAKARANEDALKRQLRMSAATQAISSDEARELQRMKLEAALAEDKQKLEMDKRKLAATVDPTSYPIYDILENFRKQGFNPRKVTQMIGSGEKSKPAPQAVLSIKEGEIFYDPNNYLYKRVPKEISSTGYVRIDESGKEIKAEVGVKKPGFFERSKESGAAYDPRSWTKQRFYEELGKKNTLSNM
jgi:hypothetical protein